jgi:multicomponent Na+:H+ antiporter subunit F
MIILMMLYALIKDIDYLLDLAIVYALLGFISIVFIARFIQRKGKI